MWSRAGRTVVVSVVLLVASPGQGHAQQPLQEAQPPAWYVGHGALVALSFSGSFLLNSKLTKEPQARWSLAPLFERGIEQHFSPFSSRVADVTLLGSLLAPPLVYGLDAESALHFGNVSLIYGEAVGLSLLLNTAVKHTIRRARPYTHGESRAAQELGARGDVDAVLSFYSGHAALSFTGATSGGVIFSAGSADLGARAGFWGAELMLASLTAHLRVRAGRHYASDVLVGAALGSLFGVLVPASHGVEMSVRPEEWSAMGIGLTAGTLMGFCFPRGVATKMARFPIAIVPHGAEGASLRVGGRW